MMELSLIDTSNLDRFEVLSFSDRQRLAKHEDCELPGFLQPRDDMGNALPGRLLWRGWATDPVTALDAVEWVL
jgi:hypothetical protein